MKKILFTLLTIFSLTVFSNAGKLLLELENDVFYDDDADMTHGTRIEYVLDNNVRFGIQQQMYTPFDISTVDQVEGRHPWAGTMLGFIGYRNINRYALYSIYDDIELSIGVLGPSSHADDVQRLIHKWLGCQDPKGWHNQLHDEFEINLTYFRGQDYLVFGHEYGWNTRFVHEIGGCLGTLQTYLGINTELKLGYGFGAAELDNEIRIRSVEFERPICSIYGILGAEGRYWIRNELLEGNAGYIHNYNTLTVDMEELTGCLKAGVGVRYKGVEARFLWMWWTREYKTQESTPNYASVTLGFGF